MAEDRITVERKARANRIGNGPYSKRIGRGLINGRSPNGRYVAHMRHDLTDHVRKTKRREPTFPETVLIEQTCVIGLRLALAAEWIDGGKTLTTNDNNQLIAWHNAFRRNLQALGLNDAPETMPAQLDALEYARQVPDELYWAQKAERERTGEAAE